MESSIFKSYVILGSCAKITATKQDGMSRECLMTQNFI